MSEAFESRPTRNDPIPTFRALARLASSPFRRRSTRGAADCNGMLRIYLSVKVDNHVDVILRGDPGSAIPSHRSARASRDRNPW